MSSSIIFELPGALLFALPMAVLLGVLGWRQFKRGMHLGRLAVLMAVRVVALSALLFLAARPTRVGQNARNQSGRPVVVLIDRSRSMSLKEPDTSRYERAVQFLRERLLPALQSAELHVQGMIFDQAAELATGPQIASAQPVGKRTNLGGAIGQALSGEQKPLAIVALTDGIANDASEDARAMNTLSASGVPFIGVGIGRDQSVPSIELRRVDAPVEVAPQTAFSLAAQLENINLGESAVCDLLLFRDGQITQKKTATLSKESRTWVETFQITEAVEGVHEYSVEVVPPNLPSLHCACARASASVRVADEREVRVLFVQGALTWDYKFISLALKGDPSIKMTGLTRTSRQSVFRQNVESESELLNGFPVSLESLSPFRVVVLSNVRPEDLSLEQQELLSRFCAELGGGVLMIGGTATFDASWQNSRLEQLLPVRFSPEHVAADAEPEFEPVLTPEAMAHPVFRLTTSGTSPNPWIHLPPFSQFGVVDDAKLGAQVWMTHPTAVGPRGPRVLMASQRYGAGLSAVLCLQNFWRWRLAKDTEPEQFDRFWRQLFRWLSDVNRPRVSISFADQELRPQTDVRVLLQRQADPHAAVGTNGQFLAQVLDGQKNLIQKTSVELSGSDPVELQFHAPRPGVYTVNVSDGASTAVASRSIEVRERDLELEQTARNMEILSQWAALSEGMVFKLEECPSAADLVTQITAKVQKTRRQEQTRHPIGLNAWTMALVLGCLTAEWLLRKHWALA